MSYNNYAYYHYKQPVVYQDASSGETLYSPRPQAYSQNYQQVPRYYPSGVYSQQYIQSYYSMDQGGARTTFTPQNPNNNNINPTPYQTQVENRTNSIYNQSQNSFKREFRKKPTDWKIKTSSNAQHSIPEKPTQPLNSNHSAKIYPTPTQVIENRTNTIYEQSQISFGKEFEKKTTELNIKKTNNDEKPSSSASPTLAKLDADNNSARTDQTLVVTENHENFPSELVFSDIPLRNNTALANSPRIYKDYRMHRINYGKDLTLRSKMDGTIFDVGALHAKMRIELFFKLSQFICDNKENINQRFEGYKIPRMPVLNQYKAQSTYKANSTGQHQPGHVHAHISFYPNLALSKGGETLFIKGGKIILNGQAVHLEEMLNLTNTVRGKVNDIDAICEAVFRVYGMIMLEQVRTRTISVEESVSNFAKKYFECMETVLALTGNAKNRASKIVNEKIQNHKKSVQNAYGSTTFIDRIDDNDFDCIMGMISGIEEWMENTGVLARPKRSLVLPQIDESGDFDFFFMK